MLDIFESISIYLVFNQINQKHFENLSNVFKVRNFIRVEKQKQENDNWSLNESSRD